MKRMNFPSRKQQRREDAEKRQEKHDALPASQQLDVLRQRGHGHCAEARRLEDTQ